MVFCQIGENRSIEFHAGHTVEAQGMGGYFHGYMGHTGFCHLEKDFLQSNNIRCRVVNRMFFVINQPVDGSNNPHLVPFLSQDMGNDMCGCGFSIGSGYRNHAHSACRIIEIERRYIFHRLAGIGYIDNRCALRHINLSGRNNSCRTLLCSRCSIIMSIHMSAIKTDKKASLFHFS